MHPILQAIATRLVPLFLTPDNTHQDAREAAIQAINAYNPKSPADYAQIARIIAFSFAAVTAVSRAEDPAISPTQQLRYLGKANTLSRSAAQAEAALARSHQPPKPSREPSQKQAPPPQDEATLIALVDNAIAECRAIAAPHPQPPRIATNKPGFRQNLMLHGALPMTVNPTA